MWTETFIVALRDKKQNKNKVFGEISRKNILDQYKEKNVQASYSHTGQKIRQVLLKESEC